MALSQLAAQDAIMDQLRAIGGIDVVEGQYLQDGTGAQIKEGGLFVPYMTVEFGTSYQSAERNIVTSRMDGLRTSVNVSVVAPSDRLSREFEADVRNALVGYYPPDSTPLAVNGGYNFIDADLGPNRYVHSTLFSFTTNMQTLPDF